MNIQEAKMSIYFSKINKKRDELIKAQMLKNEKEIKRLEYEIDVLMNKCFIYIDDKILF